VYLVKGMQELNAKVNNLTLEAKKFIIDGVDVGKKLTELSNKVIELSNKVESQQKQIEELSKQLREMKN
jgi:predicted  nucleic acid-binding Zn-ribbon protein